MAFPYRFENREVIRVKAKKCDGLMQPEYKKFCIDPQITSFEMLQNLLARAFSIISDFTISYLITEPDGHTAYLTLLSDWDMDAAFQTASDPCLKLKVDLKPFDESLDDWDVIAPLDIPTNRFASLFEKGSVLMSLSDSISNRMEKTMSQVNKAIGRRRSDSGKGYQALKSPMSDAEFFTYLDTEGRLIRPQEFRLNIYQGGIEPALRRVAWRHLLNVFPPCLTGKERFDYLKERERQYYSLRDEWKQLYNSEVCPEHLKQVTSLVKKDVLRTDRTHPFYAGSDDNTNVVSLLHVLVTYAVTHPSVSYCQGMSDIASPLLVVQKDEAQAYICFCAIMHRLHRNFLLDGVAMSLKFQHLADLIRFTIPGFFDYLTCCSAMDMFFCFRWLLLETKREFPLDKALYMLEVMWSTLPPAPSDYEVTLTDRDYYTSNLSTLPPSPPFSSKQTVYTKFLTRHRQNSIQSFPGSLDEKVVGSSMNNNSSVCNCDCSPIYEDSTDSSVDFSSIEITRSLQEKASQIDMSLKYDCGSTGSSCDGDVNTPSCSLSSNSSVLCDTESFISDEICSHCGKVSVDGDLKNLSVDDGFDSAICEKESSEEQRNEDKSSSFEFLNSAGHTGIEGSHDDGPSRGTMSREGRSNTTFDAYFVTQELRFETKTELPLASCLENEDAHGSHAGTTELGVTTDLLLADCHNDRHDSFLFDEPRCATIVDREDIASQLFRDECRTVVDCGTGQAGDYGSADTVENVSDSTVTEDDADEEIPFAEDTLDTLETSEPPVHLPPPEDFGAGNPFLMFICLAMVLQHSDYITRNRLDYDEMAMHFDKMVRKHQVDRVLHQARLLYCDYLREQQRIATELPENEACL